MKDLVSEQSEMAVIASALTSKQSLYKMLEYPEEIFFYDKNQILYRKMKELNAEGEHIDSVVLASTQPGLHKYIADLLQCSTINIDYVLKDLQTKAQRRRVMKIAEELHKTGGAEDIYQKLLDLQDEIFQTVNRDGATVKGMADKNLSEIFRESSYHLTGLQALDDKIHGFFDGQLIIIAGRPKMGKSTLAIQLIINMNLKTTFLSLEMTRREVYSKMLALKSQCEAWRIETGAMREDELKRVLQAHADYKLSHDIVIHDADSDIQSIKSIIKKEQPSLAVVDYLQLIKGGPGDNQNLRIAGITRDLKLMAHALDIPIILLSQLSRAGKDGRPQSYQLRDSGAIEQDCDVCIFTHENDGKTEIIVGENRKGPKGIIKGIDFVKEYSQFKDSDVQNFEEAIGISKEVL